MSARDEEEALHRSIVRACDDANGDHPAIELMRSSSQRRLDEITAERISEAPDRHAAAPMPSCGTCKHWVPDRDWQDERWGDCTLLSDGDRDDTAGVYIDNSGHHGCGVAFTCPASFGCTEHQPRPSEDAS